MTYHLFKTFSREFFTLYIVLLSGITCILAFHPGHNGDMPFYIVCVVEKERGTMDGAVAATQDILRKELPANEYAEHSLRIAQASPGLFDFYRIKPFYILLVLVFHQLGLSYTFSTFLPSLIAYFLTGLSIWRFIIQRLDPRNTFLISLICMIIPPMIHVARLSSPDALSCFILVNALLLIIYGRNKIIWFSLFAIAICTRLDNVVNELIFLFALWQGPAPVFKNKLSAKQFAFFSLILVGLSLLVNITCTQRFLHITSPFYERAVGAYALNVGYNLKWILNSFFTTTFIIFIFHGLSQGLSIKNETNWIFYSICSVVFVRFILYPFYEERYVVPFFLVYLLLTGIFFAGGGKSSESLSKTGG